MRLILLFTYGMSLESWRRQGLIDRELSYFRYLQRAGVDAIDFFTYSPADAVGIDSRAAVGADGFGVLPRPRWLGHSVYSLLGPLVRFSAFRRATIIRSNQSRGAWTGVVAKSLRRSLFFVVRCGWVRTREMMRVDERLDGFWLRWAEMIERRTFRSADAVFVTSPVDREYVASTYGIDAGKIEVMPNAVDTTIFSPSPVPRLRARTMVISVGRLVEMKNFQSLIRAVAEFDPPVDLTLVGDGPYRGELERLAVECGARVAIRPSIANSSLPEALHEADVFVMPQLYGSGMSKVILEAMACGVIVVASNIVAHREVITDGVNGFLCGTGPADLRVCLGRVLALDAASRAAVVTRARRDVEEKYSMASLAQREVAFYREALAKRRMTR